MKRRLALIGSKGMLASAVRDCAGAEWDLVSLDLPEFDITDSYQVESQLGDLCPEVIINCAAYTNVDGAESEEHLALQVNGAGVANLAKTARQLNALLIHVSTDYVFDGTKTTPYCEEDPVAPISAYGRSKLAGERAILSSGLERYYIIRTSWLYGPNGKNFVETIIRLARERDELRVVADQIGTPTYTRDLAAAIFNLLMANPRARYGIYHFSNSGQCSWCEFATEIIGQVQDLGEILKVKRVEPIRTKAYPLPAPRPAYSVFSKSRYIVATGINPPDWQTALQRYLEERSHH